MQIIRGARPERNFAIISNYVLRDSALSYRARGVLCCVLSFAENYRISADRLADMGKEGRDAIRVALSELEDSGYLKRNKQQDAQGHWSTSAIISDVPDLSVRKTPVLPEPKTDFQSSVNQPSVDQALKEDQEEDKKKKKEAQAPEVPKITFDGKQFNDLNKDQIALWAAAYPAIDVQAQVLQAAVWLDANPANKKSDYKRFLNGWLSRAQDKAPRVQGNAAPARQYSAPRRTPAPDNFQASDYGQGGKL